jgi:hypothetical protein
MIENAERALIYRQNAERLRDTASDIKDTHSSEALRKVAAEYDYLAAIQEQLAKVNNATLESKLI